MRAQKVRRRSVTMAASAQELGRTGLPGMHVPRPPRVPHRPQATALGSATCRTKARTSTPPTCTLPSASSTSICPQSPSQLAFCSPLPANTSPSEGPGGQVSVPWLIQMEKDQDKARHLPRSRESLLLEDELGCPLPPGVTVQGPHPKDCPGATGFSRLMIPWKMSS